VSDVTFLVGVGGGFAALAVGALMRRRARDEAAAATGLLPADLSHLPASLQKTALWSLSDGGFESGALAGTMHRGSIDIEVTAFELETLRERRGEWAYLPVATPFKIDGVMRIVVFRIGRRFPHVLLKRAGVADQLPTRTAFERTINAAAAARVALGQREGQPAELPPTLPAAALDLKLPDGWRAYGADAVFATQLAREPVLTTLAEEGSPDQVVELLDDLIIIYHARSQRMRDFGDAGATPWPRMAQYLIDDGLQLVDAIAKVTAHLDPRGVQPG
jgi:hypothetical protein